MFSPAIRCWAVLLAFYLAGFPLYAQVRDTVKSAPGAEKTPAHRSAPVSAVAPSLHTQNAVQGPDEEKDTLETSFDHDILLEQRNNSVSPVPPPSQTETGLQRGDQASNAGDYLQGVIDGKRDARGKPLWILAGLAGSGLCICFGAAGIGLAVAVPYYPSGEDLLGKSSSYIEGYIAGYKSATRWKNAGWATLGFALAIVIDIALDLSITFGNFHISMTN